MSPKRPDSQPDAVITRIIQPNKETDPIRQPPISHPKEYLNNWVKQTKMIQSVQ
jgi:hypothetical protein